MADSLTQNYNLVKPEPGSQGWDGKLNQNLDVIDQQMADSAHLTIWRLPAFKATYVNAVTVRVPGNHAAIFEIGRALAYDRTSAPGVMVYAAVTTAGVYNAGNDWTTFGLIAPNDIDNLFISLLSATPGSQGGWPNNLDAKTLKGKDLSGTVKSGSFSSLNGTQDFDLDFSPEYGQVRTYDAAICVSNTIDSNAMTMTVIDSSGLRATPFIGTPGITFPARPSSGTVLRCRVITTAALSGGVFARILKQT